MSLDELTIVRNFSRSASGISADLLRNRSAPCTGLDEGKACRDVTVSFTSSCLFDENSDMSLRTPMAGIEFIGLALLPDPSDAGRAIPLKPSVACEGAIPGGSDPDDMCLVHSIPFG